MHHVGNAHDVACYLFQSVCRCNFTIYHMFRQEPSPPASASLGASTHDPKSVNTDSAYRYAVRASVREIREAVYKSAIYYIYGGHTIRMTSIS